MSRPRIILDVDGVLADFTGHTLALLGEHAPPGGREAFTTWDLLTTLSPEARAMCAHGWRRPGWCGSMPTLPDAQHAVDRLSLRAEIVYATAPMEGAPHWMLEREKWLIQQFAVDRDNVVFTHDKSHVWGDVFVDDKPENIDRWAKVHRNGMALLWNAPYNQSWRSTLPNTRRVVRWAEVFEALPRRTGQLV
jgi:5'(3')-deoxyribonucleotidase